MIGMKDLELLLRLEKLLLGREVFYLFTVIFGLTVRHHTTEAYEKDGKV